MSAEYAEGFPWLDISRLAEKNDFEKARQLFDKTKGLLPNIFEAHYITTYYNSGLRDVAKMIFADTSQYAFNLYDLDYVTVLLFYEFPESRILGLLASNPSSHDLGNARKMFNDNYHKVMTPETFRLSLITQCYKAGLKTEAIKLFEDTKTFPYVPGKHLTEPWQSFITCKSLARGGMEAQAQSLIKQEIKESRFHNDEWSSDDIKFIFDLGCKKEARTLYKKLLPHATKEDRKSVEELEKMIRKTGWFGSG